MGTRKAPPGCAGRRRSAVPRAPDFRDALVGPCAGLAGPRPDAPPGCAGRAGVPHAEDNRDALVGPRAGLAGPRPDAPPGCVRPARCLLRHAARADAGEGWWALVSEPWLA